MDYKPDRSRATALTAIACLLLVAIGGYGYYLSGRAGSMTSATSEETSAGKITPATPPAGPTRAETSSPGNSESTQPAKTTLSETSNSETPDSSTASSVTTGGDVTPLQLDLAAAAPVCPDRLAYGMPDFNDRSGGWIYGPASSDVGETNAAVLLLHADGANPGAVISDGSWCGASRVRVLIVPEGRDLGGGLAGLGWDSDDGERAVETPDQVEYITKGVASGIAELGSSSDELIAVGFGTGASMALQIACNRDYLPSIDRLVMVDPKIYRGTGPELCRSAPVETVAIFTSSDAANQITPDGSDYFNGLGALNVVLDAWSCRRADSLPFDDSACPNISARVSHARNASDVLAE